MYTFWFYGVARAKTTWIQSVLMVRDVGLSSSHRSHVDEFHFATSGPYLEKIWNIENMKMLADQF